MTEHRVIHQAGPDGVIAFCAAGCPGRWPCASASDLTGHQKDGWTVLVKAPAQNRKPHWTARHSCGHTEDVGQAAIRVGALPPCAACTGSVPAEDTPMHLACGQRHPVGELCGPEVIPQLLEAMREPIARLERLDDITAVRATADPTATVILDVIRAAMLDNPRSLQVELGPSELGGCERRLGHRIAFGKAEETDPDALWRPTVGTAVHAWLADVFGGDSDLWPVWLSAARVTAPIEGELDLFHIPSGTVVDFKVTGETTRKRALRRDVDAKYETQLDLYGAGLVAEGYGVQNVALLFLPASGSLADAVWYSRPFDPDNAARAVERYRRVDVQVKTAEMIGGEPAIRTILGILETTPDNCAYCPALGHYCEGAPGANLWAASAASADPVWPAWEEALAREAGAA